MKWSVALILIALTNNLFAHGEDHLGPHGGFIRMPATFHAELVPKEKNVFHVYLMDVNNKNATVKDSSVVFIYEQNHKKNNEIKCQALIENFICRQNSNIDMKEGIIKLKAVRNGVQGRIAEYLLPLSLK